ncbi:hypothetical protein HMPREF0645_0053 [Hallella bergensis DSM 17361]|uniref:Uncharacterized protein n=1 Tax=Hallella bergensis DSM 17361 TaxID=585502 RepID=D1PSW0_9BACT|nr:hypothetical protein HMPREF0645_0053 [Hallella bergensis DSM 17361]
MSFDNCRFLFHRQKYGRYRRKSIASVQMGCQVVKNRLSDLFKCFRICKTALIHKHIRDSKKEKKNQKTENCTFFIRCF